MDTLRILNRMENMKSVFHAAFFIDFVTAGRFYGRYRKIRRIRIGRRLPCGLYVIFSCGI